MASQKNLWLSQPGLASAFARGLSESQIETELVCREVAAHLTAAAGSILDIGGGLGLDALWLASAGHRVTLADIDARMIAGAQVLLSRVDQEVRDRIELLNADGKTLKQAGEFDAVCLHSVVQYEPEPLTLIMNAALQMRHGGILSLVAPNPEAAAMRPAFAGRWREAKRNLLASTELGSEYAEARYLSREMLTTLIEGAGLAVTSWRGISVFADHLGEDQRRNTERLIELEWIAGNKDPYRGVARCFQIVASDAGMRPGIAE